MKMADRILYVQECLRALGDAYRHDWSEVDGRQLRSELSEVSSILTCLDAKILPFDTWLQQSSITKREDGGYEWDSWE